MFSPVGNLPPSVYWRRRLFVVGAGILLILLIALTINVAAGSGAQQPVAGAGTSTSNSPSPDAAAATRSAPASSTPAATTRATGAASATPTTSLSSGSTGSATTAPPAQCVAGDLAVQAAVGKTSYKVGDKPVVSMQVTNVSERPCVQDLADKQIVLRLYNGESRVWGSHDCEIQPGTTDRTLPINQPVRVSITWSGTTSQEGCKGARQRVGAGTYTLYAALAGKSGKAASFTIS